MAEPIIQQLQVRRPEKDRFSRKEASKYLDRIGCPTSVRVLEWLGEVKNSGKGPPFFAIRGRTYYERVDLDRWAETQKTRKG